MTDTIACDAPACTSNADYGITAQGGCGSFTGALCTAHKLALEQVFPMVFYVPTYLHPAAGVQTDVPTP